MPYFGFLFDQALEVLEAYATGDIRETILWDFVVRSAQGALVNDAGGQLHPSVSATLEVPTDIACY